MSSFAGLPPSWRTLGIALLIAVGCDTSAPRSVVFEGTIPPNLKFRANAAISTLRDSVFCKGFLFQHPTPHETARKAHFERVPGNRYRAVIDLRDAPHGGFCHWYISMVGFGVEDVRDEYLNTMISSLRPKTYSNEPALLEVTKIRCRIDTVPVRPDLRCDELRDGAVYYPRRYAVDLSGDVRIKLDITFDSVPWYPPEWDRDPTQRPKNWQPGQPAYPPEWDEDPSLRPPDWAPRSG